MTIQDLGSLGELIAVVATVVTLVYLAIQLKQNTPCSYVPKPFNKVAWI